MIEHNVWTASFFERENAEATAKVLERHGFNVERDFDDLTTPPAPPSDLVARFKVLVEEQWIAQTSEELTADQLDKLLLTTPLSAIDTLWRFGGVRCIVDTFLAEHGDLG